MANKEIRETFNDGMLKYGHKETLRSSTKKRIGETFIEEGKLAYRELSERDADYRLADIKGASLDLKVKTLCPPSFKKVNKNKLIVVIDLDEFEVIKVDSDKQKQYLYFYLQRVGAHNE